MRVAQRAMLFAKATLILIMVPAAALGQRSGYATGGGDVSPTVFMTYFARVDGGQTYPELPLVVLWRGSPGWKDGRISGTSAPYNVFESELRQRRQHLLEMGLETARATVRVAFDPLARRVDIMGQELMLGNNNVVLVDSVDSTPTIVAVMQVNLVLEANEDFAEGLDALGRRTLILSRVLERSAGLLEFVR